MSNFIPSGARIYVAGHRGLAGSAIVRHLKACGYENLLLRTHKELDLTDRAAVETFFFEYRPDFVFLAAAKVGGILANNNYPADFILQNLLIQNNVIEAAWHSQVNRLLFLGSSCIYPRMAPQPMREESLLTGPLEYTNRAYAVAKIAGIEMCWAFNRQHGTGFLAAMPTNLYGPGDNYDLAHSHVLPALIRKVHEALDRGDKKIVLWGTGKPLREFLYSDDMAAACVHLLNLPVDSFEKIVRDPGNPPLINVGSGEEITISTLLEVVCKVLNYQGEIELDATKPDGTPRKLMDNSRMRSFGWKPEIGLEEGIGLAYAAFLNRS
jgi:GDP-L-fucose synthase